MLIARSHLALGAVLVWGFLACTALTAQEDRKTLRVFLFGGQSNMEGADSHVEDIDSFPPFEGLGEPQPEVRFHYSLGRENPEESNGWVALQPARGMVGPELSFARMVGRHVEAPIAILKVAAGGTHLGGDWNPDEPSGFEMYPRMLKRVRAALADLEARKIPYRIEAFVWHQGENDMFNEDYRAHYGRNLANFLASWRRDLEVPDLQFQIGELCCKTIWGMDLRPRMYDIFKGQKAVTESDPNAVYVPTNHVGVEIGGGVGLHYHYGTLGQLQHGESHAETYLRRIGKLPEQTRELKRWPYADGSKITLFVLAGHRNMEGERAFVAQLGDVRGGSKLAKDDPSVAFRYDVGGGFRTSDGWEPLGPAGFNETFGPELSFAARLKRGRQSDFAIAKYTHSGSQVIDWCPEGSVAKDRRLYARFLVYVRDSIRELEERGHQVELAGIFYHLGENDMSWGGARSQVAKRLQSLVTQSREDLGMPDLRWFVSQQEPTDHERVSKIDVLAQVEEVAAADPHLIHIRAFGLPGREKELVISTPGIVALGELLAETWLDR